MRSWPRPGTSGWEHQISGLRRVKGQDNGSRLQLFRLKIPPDRWEKSALEAFKGGAKEYYRFVDVQNQPYLRFLKPLATSQMGPKPQASSGRPVQGNVQALVGGWFPMQDLLREQADEIVTHLVFLGAIYALGILAMVTSVPRMSPRYDTLTWHPHFHR